MEFYDESNNKIDTAHLELPEQILADKYITSDCIVLELGARYGSVSCIINKKIGFTNNQVSVEPDDRVWEALENNKKRNNCNFHIYKGFVSKKSLKLTNLDVYHNGYGSTFEDVSNSIIESITLEELQNKYNLKFNTLVADCEGFLERFLDENPILYDQLNMIIFEQDYPDKCDYKKIMSNLFEKNFKLIRCLKFEQYVFQK